MKTKIKYNNFTSGVLDSTIQGRVDSPLYNNSLRKCDNFFINETGGLMFRGGYNFEYELYTGLNNGDLRNRKVVEKIDVPLSSNFNLIGFVYEKDDKTQTMIAFYIKKKDEKIRFWSSIIVDEFSGGYKEKEIRWCQYYSNLIFVSSNFPPIMIKIDVVNNSLIKEVISFTQTGENQFLGSLGNPLNVAFFCNRLVFIGIGTNYTKIAVSNISNPFKFDFDPATIPAEGPKDKTLYAWTKTLLNIKSKVVFCLNMGSFLSIFTSTEILIIETSSSFVPSNSDVKVCDFGVSFEILPFIFKDNLFFFSTDNITLYQIQFSMEANKYRALELNKYRKDVFRQNRPLKIARKQDNNTIQVLCKNNIVVNMYINLELDILAFNTFSFHDDFIIDDLFNISSGIGNDEIYFITKRLLNNSWGDYYLYFYKYILNYLPYLTYDEFYLGGSREDELNSKNAYNRYISEFNRNLVYLDSNIEVSNKINSIGNRKLKNIVDNNNNYLSFDDDSDISSLKESVLKIYDRNNELCMLIETFNLKSNNLLEYNIKIKDVDYANFNQYMDELYIKNNQLSLYFNKLLDLSNTIFDDDFYVGKKLSVIADNNYLGEYEILVKNGVRYIDCVGSKFQIGYKYIGKIITNSFGYDFNGNTTQVTLKQINKVILRLNNTFGGKIGTSFSNMQYLHMTDGHELTDIGKLPLNFDKEVIFADNSDKKKSLYIIKDEPESFNIDLITVEMEALI